MMRRSSESGKLSGSKKNSGQTEDKEDQSVKNRPLSTRRSNKSKGEEVEDKRQSHKEQDVLEESQNKSATDLESDKCSSSLGEVQPLKLAFDRYKDHYDSLPLITLFDEIMKTGICPNEDERLAGVRDALTKIYKDRKLTDIVLNYDLFKQIVEPVGALLLKILNNNLAIQNVEEWCKCLSIYYDTIKELTKSELEISITSADGQRLKWGSKRKKFPLNELVHIINYLMATEISGFNKIHETIGLDVKPNSEWEPANPLSGGGALAVASYLVHNTLACKTSTEKHEKVKKLLSDLCGGADVLFDINAYIASVKKSDYIKSVLYWMKGKDIACKDVDKVAQFYLESCNLQIDCDALSVLGATLANGGVGATNGGKIFCSECVEKVLSVMTITSSRPGIPVVVSSSGAVLVIAPSVLSVAVYSEDSSAIGYFLSALFRHFALNPYERLFLQRDRHVKDNSCAKSALFASARLGDVLTLATLLDAGISLGSQDYMKRTALHVSAARGHVKYTRLLMNNCPKLTAVRDLAGRTPIDEARFFERKEIIKMLENWETVSLGPPTSKKSNII